MKIQKQIDADKQIKGLIKTLQEASPEVKKELFDLIKSV